MCVHIYKNDKNYIFIPNGNDKDGVTRHLDKFVLLDIHSKMEGLGEALKEMVTYSLENGFIAEPKNLPSVFSEAVGIKSWSKFFIQHECVLVFFTENKFLKIEYWFKDYNYKSYTVNDNYYKCQIPLACSNKELGEKVVEAFTLKKNNNIQQE